MKKTKNDKTIVANFSFPLQIRSIILESGLSSINERKRNEITRLTPKTPACCEYR